jgi:chloride channel protein, CIC family
LSTPLLRTERLWLRENQLFLILTIAIGVLAGLSAVLFTVAIEQTGRRLFGLSPSIFRLVAVPPLVSLLTGFLLAKFFPDVRGSGVPQTEAAYHLADGVIPARVPFGKFLTGVLCIGSGHSMGREGPSVQIGAGLASVIGRWMRLSPENVRDLVPVGAAAALSAAFNTPVAAVLFALEEIIGDMNAALLGSTVVASVAAVIVERSILGNEPLFHVPTYQLVHPAELAAYAVLGIIGGALSVAFCKALLATRRLFLRLPLRSKVFQPAMGGLVIGVILVFVPAVMGVGYEYVGQALNGGLLLKTMVLLCLVKLAATVVSYSSGNAGGIFAPSLFIGAMAGGAVGMLVHAYAPFPTAEPGAYALVGMGTLFAGIIRAPMTSVFMIFEITQDHQILVPLMVANMLSYAISKRYQKAPVYHALLQQDDVHLPSLAAPAAGPARTARHLMRVEAPFVAADVQVEAAWRLLADQDAPAHLVGSRQHLVGCVTRQQLERWMAAGKSAEAVGAVVDGQTVHVYPDHPIDVVLDRFAQTGGLLPVMSRTAVGRVEGVVTLDSILTVIDRRARHRETQAPVAAEDSRASAVKVARTPLAPH